MAKNKKSKKKKGYNPPLTFLDKFIYILFLIISGILSFSLVLIPVFIQKKITFTDSSAIAFETTGSIFWILPLTLYILLSAWILGICGLEDSIPLFGNPNLRYGEPPFKRNTYPLFRRKKYVKEIKNKKKPWYKNLIIVWCTVFFILACLFPLGICGRRVLYDDSSITIFDSFNSEKITYSPDNFESLTISTYRNWSRYSYHWSYQIKINMSDGKKIYFADKVSEDAIDEFIEIKEMINKDNIVIEGKHNLDEVITDMKCNQSQSEKLRQLFSE